MAPVKRTTAPANFAETFKFKDSDRILYGFQKWISRSHPRNPDDIDDRHLRKTVERLEKQSRDSAAKHAAKSTILPWKELNGIWGHDRDAVDRQRKPSALHDISHWPVRNGARQSRATWLRDLTKRFRPMYLEVGLPDGDEQAWLTPRMAARLHVVAMELADMIEKEEYHVISSRLPHFAQTFLDPREHPGWRDKLARCFRRIAEELAVGQPPNPDSTGDHMAMHITIQVAEERCSFGYFEAAGIDQEIAAHPHDSDWEQARESAYEAKEIKVLFELGIADPHMIGLILPESSHLHPSQWFCSRRPQDCENGNFQQPLTVMRKAPRAVKVASPTMKQFSVDLRSPSAGVLVVPEQRSLRRFLMKKERGSFATLPGLLTYDARSQIQRKKPIVGR